MGASAPQRAAPARLWVGAAAALMAFVAFSGPASADPGTGGENANDSAADHSNASQHQPVDTASDSTQPETTADGGASANTTGPYDSTSDGSASDNGNGDGGGVPCAGCVGNADDQNPGGQMPGGNDQNKGYECDGNSGVARTNPAHSGCVRPTTEEPPECDDSVEVCEPTDSENPETLGEDITTDAAVEGAALARTGIDVLDPATFAALMLLGGGALLVASRRLQRAKH